MLAGLLLGAIRQVWRQSFNALPPLASPVALPAPASHLRYSLLRSLRPMRRKVTLYQMGGTEFSELYMLGQSILQPALANILIKNGWVVPGDKHWVEAVIAYHLSTAGLVIEQQLEVWWGQLTLDQRLRAALLE